MDFFVANAAALKYLDGHFVRYSCRGKMEDIEGWTSESIRWEVAELWHRTNPHSDNFIIT